MLGRRAAGAALWEVVEVREEGINYLYSKYIKKPTRMHREQPVVGTASQPNTKLSREPQICK
jgi:hypothetical protein